MGELSQSKAVEVVARRSRHCCFALSSQTFVAYQALEAVWDFQTGQVSATFCTVDYSKSFLTSSTFAVKRCSLGSGLASNNHERSAGLRSFKFMSIVC